MITLDEELENIKNDTTKIGTKPPRIQTLSDVKNSTYGTDSEVKQLISDVESDISNVLGSAVFERGVQNLKNLPEQLQIYGGQALMSLGGFVDSDKTVSMGKELIKSARGELQADEKKFWESSTPLSEKDMESFTYGLGLGIANYGSMLAIGYLNPVAGITLGSAVEIGQQAEEKIGYHIEETGDTELNKYTSQKAQKDTLYTTIYGVGSAIIEKKFGLGKQLKLVKMPITSKLKHVIETAVSEGGTETLQELYATGLDWQGGYIDSSKLPERFMDALKEGVIGAVLGGGLGVASAVNHRSQAKAILRDSLKNTVPEKDLDNVVDGIYESANDSMSTVVAQELIQSESLRNKHGAIYESIKSEVSKQIKNTGAFADVDEMKLSQYIESTAKMFADQVLGEANKRKVVIDDVLKDSEIIYKDGRLYLQGKIEKPKVIRKPKQYNPERMELLTYLKYKGGLKDVGGELKSMDTGRQIIGLINNKNGRSLDDAMLDAWESGYFPQFSERPTVNDLLNAIDDSLRGNKIYRESFRSTIEQRQAKEKEIENEEQLNMFLSDFISEEDLDTMSLQDKQRFYDDINEQANAISEDDYIQQEINSLTDAEAERYAIMTENGATHDEAMQEIESNRTVDEDIPLFFQESFDIADENARLDDIYPEYKGETININGVEKTVYNSNGDRIAMSEPALRNFYKWFGDSKAVNEQGRPLVVYHGTDAEFDVFDRLYSGKRTGATNTSLGLFFTPHKDYAGVFGKKIIPVYLKIQNPLSLGYASNDGVFISGNKKERLNITRGGANYEFKDGLKTIKDAVIEKYGEYTYDNVKKWSELVESMGFDGIKVVTGDTPNFEQDFIPTSQYIVFNPNQIKSTSNRGTYSESDNIYYQTEELNDESKNIEFNMVSLKDKTSVDYLKEVALSKGMTNKQFDALMNKVFTVADSINDALKDNPDWKQWNAKQIKTFADSQGIPLPIRSIFVKNGDYDFNIDLGTLCVKREFADKVISHLIDKGYGNQIGLVKLEQIKALLRKYEIAVACDVCFIEGKRLNARTLSNGLAYEWESVRIALGINDNLSIGSVRTFTEQQNKMLEQMTDRRFIKDDGSIMSEEEYDSMSTEDKKNFSKEHKMVFQKAYEDYMPVERRRVKIGKTVYDRGITSDKMYSIAKLFRQNSELAGEFDPDTLMNSEQTTALVERYFDTELPSFIGSYAGAGTPKPLLGFNPYYELSWRDKYDRNADRLNQMLFEIGGVRGQSFSDYNEMLVIDYIQKYLALTVRALPSHEYTKQSSLVKTFGDIGVMYNMSFVPKIEDGIDAKHYGLRRATEEEIKNGKSKEGFILKEDDQGIWTYSFHEDSFPIKDAIELRNKFDKTSGIIVVGVSDMQIEMMLNDPMIDMIIPFHASGMPAHTKLMTGLVDVDYSKVQTTKGLKTGQDDFSYNAKLREIGDPRKTAQAYIDWCRENGLKEKFPQFSKHENYYKLLEDFRGYDKSGKPIIQGAVDVSKADWNRIQTEGISGVKERYNVVKTAESTLVSEEFTKELEDIFRYQQVDTEVQNLFKKRLTGVLGKGNAIFLKQKTFLEKVRELSGAEVFRSNQDGTVYGFAQGNKVYINESVFNAHTPAHEFTHIWSKVVQQYNPKLWKKGVELLKETNMWKDVQKDEMYWQIQGDENAVAREVLARLTGTESEDMIKQMLDYHTKGHANAKSLVQRIMNFIKEMFGTLKDAFNLKSDIDITFEDFIRMPLRDLLDQSRHKTFKDAQKKINKDGISEFDDKSIEYNAVSKLKQNKIKGSFDKLTKSIKITSEADFSSLQHEFAHFWLDNIWNYANSGQASENYLKQFNEIKKWLGTKGNYPTRNQHEKFARAYEKYLYKGTNADAPIGQAFKDYENFIREVYSDIAEIDTRAGVKYRAVPKLVYDFFDSMVSGKLPGVIVDDEPEKEVEKEVKEVKEFIKEETKVLEENRANYTLKPVQTDTKTGYLTAYEKMTGEQVEAGSIELKDQMEKAENFVANNLEQAERIVNGLEQAPEGIVKNAVYIAYNNLQKKLGNTDKRANSMLNQALELRRMGQEIASQRLAYADVEGEASATFWIKEVIRNKAEALADANGITVTELSDKIDNAISDGIANNKKPEDIVKQLGEELGVTEFYQTEVLSGFGDVDTYAHSYIKRYVNERLGLGMSKTEAETIIRKADDMLASLQNSMSKTGNPSVDYFVKLKDMENYANSLAPSSNARVLVSVIGRGNLLASIKSPVTNIVSNGFVGAFRGVVRRINLGVANSIVSPELIKQNKAYSWEIFKKTGYNVNNITKDKPRNLILGEELTHSKGKGLIRKLGRGYEEIVYKWGLGAGDVLFKDYAFTDYVALKATKLAKGDVNKANEIFKDACLIEPKTKDGAEIREEAIQESLIATYQNDSAISESALTVRKKMDLGIGFGEFIAPFVKTPANVVSMGLKSGFGSVRAIFSEIKRDVKAGKILKPTQENIDLVVQNGLGLLLASALMSAIDDDDYMPPYALASSKDKQLAKELNIPYNAIRIGNTWVSLDYLGVLASPLMGLLQARRENGIINSIFGYIKSGGIQALSIPAFGEVADVFEKIKNSVRKSGEDTLAVAGGELLEQTYARVVPSIFSDVAKALDSYDRETKGDEIRTKIPWARERAFEKVSVTSGVAEELGSPISDLLFGSRVKEQVTNDVAEELQRLNNAGWGVSLTTVTRSGLLSELDEDTKQKVREDFAVEYSKQVKRLIKGSKYKRSSDEDKQEMINKIRRDIISGLKRRYLKKKKQ